MEWLVNLRMRIKLLRELYPGYTVPLDYRLAYMVFAVPFLISDMYGGRVYLMYSSDEAS